MIQHIPVDEPVSIFLVCGDYDNQHHFATEVWPNHVGRHRVTVAPLGEPFGSEEIQVRWVREEDLEQSDLCVHREPDDGAGI